MLVSICLLTPQLALWVLLIRVLPDAFALWIKIKPTAITGIDQRLLIIALSLLTILLVAATYKYYALLMINNNNLGKYIALSNVIAANLCYFKCYHWITSRWCKSARVLTKDHVI
ncbi:MAG: phosphoethanolamine transferase domain-containing protein [Candidatus Malihini olakiniferum]